MYLNWPAGLKSGPSVCGLAEMGEGIMNRSKQIYLILRVAALCLAPVCAHLYLQCTLTLLLSIYIPSHYSQNPPELMSSAQTVKGEDLRQKSLNRVSMGQTVMSALYHPTRDICCSSLKARFKTGSHPSAWKTGKDGLFKLWGGLAGGSFRL